MALVRGFALALAAFIASFALHIVGGATDQGWLFATAVALIFLTATGFPALTVIFAGGVPAASRFGNAVLVAATGTGTFFTAAALWAANGRSLAWWEPPLALLLVGVVSGSYFLWRRRTPRKLAIA